MKYKQTLSIDQLLPIETYGPCPQINQKLLNVRGGDFSDDLPLGVGHNIFGGVVVERYRFGPVVNTDGKPFFPYEPGEACFGAVTLTGLDALRVIQVFARACLSRSAATRWAALVSWVIERFCLVLNRIYNGCNCSKSTKSLSKTPLNPCAPGIGGVFLLLDVCQMSTCWTFLHRSCLIFRVAPFFLNLFTKCVGDNTTEVGPKSSKTSKYLGRTEKIVSRRLNLQGLPIEANFRVLNQTALLRTNKL